MATPQEFEHNNNTLFFRFLSLCFLFFLCFVSKIASAKSPDKLSIIEVTRRSIANTNSAPLTAILESSNGQLIYAANNRIFINENSLPNINLLDENENFRVNRIYQQGNDFYFATNIGLIRNQERIFSKTAVNDLIFIRDRIYLCTNQGLYSSDLTASHWELLAKANMHILQCIASLKSKKNFYLLSNNGFYLFDTKKKNLLKINQGLKGGSDSEFNGRLLLIKKEKEELLYLALANSVYKLDSTKKYWRKLSNKGLNFDQNSQLQVFNFFHRDKKLFLLSSTGLFYAELNLGDDITHWEKLSSAEFNLNENFLEGFTAMADIREARPKRIIEINRDFSILLGNFRGDLYQVTLGYTDKSQDLAISQETIQKEIIIEEPSPPNISENIILKLLSVEPSIQETQAKALEFSGIPSGNQFNTYKKQARLRNIFPQFDSTFNNSDYVFSSLETNGSDKYDSGDSSINSSLDKNSKNTSDNEFNTGFRLTWHLDNLIYDPEVIDIVNSARISANIRENLLTELTQLYFQRKQLLIELLTSPFSRNLKQRLKLQELNADLDARTGGWFTNALRIEIIQNPDLKKILEEAEIEN